MRRFPAAKKLAKELSSKKTLRRQDVTQSIAYLHQHRTELEQYESIEHLALSAYGDQPSRSARALGKHIEAIRAVLARELWARRLFIGVTVLDDMLFYAARDAAVADPILEVLERIRDSGLHRPGLIIFPLHSFGVLGAGLLGPLRSTRYVYVNSSYDLALTPQTNSMRQTLDFMEDIRGPLSIRKRIPEDLIEHWRRSRGARWLERNPLLAVRVATISGYYYENEFLLLGRLRALTTFITMLSTLQPRAKNEAGASIQLLLNKQLADSRYSPLYCTVRRTDRH